MLLATDPGSVPPQTSGASYDPSHLLHTWAAVVILAIILLHHILRLWVDFFHCPQFLVKHFRKRLKEEVRETLAEIGFDESLRERLERATLEEKLDHIGRYDDAPSRCITLLKKNITYNSVDVGSTERIVSPYFIDIMSASLDPDVADECATILASHLRSIGGHKAPFDAIVGLKRGSLLIAAMLGKKLHKPVAVYRGKDDYKHTPSSQSPDLLFDGTLASGSRVLIVDDSTTGGRKVLDCVEAVRKKSCKVEKCLVLFEPIGKGARTLLMSNGVELVAVVRMDKPTQIKLGVPRPKEEPSSDAEAKPEPPQA